MSGTGDGAARRAWVKKILNIDIAEPVAASDAELRASLAERIRDVAAMANNLAPAAKLELITRAKAAKTAIDGTDLLAAEIAVEQLEAFYAESIRAATMGEAEQLGKGRVKYRKLQLQWRRAQGEALSALEALADAVLADPEMQEDPLYPDVQEAASGITELMPDFGEDLESVFNALDRDISDEEAADLRGEAIDVIDDYCTTLDQASELSRLQAFADEEYGSYASFRVLQDTLQALRRELSAG